MKFYITVILAAVFGATIVSAAYETQFTFGSRLKGAKPFVNYLDCVEKVVKQNVSKWSSNKEIQHFILSGSLPRYSAALSTLHKCVSSRAVASCYDQRAWELVKFYTSVLNDFRYVDHLENAQIHKAVSKCNVKAKSEAAKELHAFLQTVDNWLNSYWEM